MNYIAIFHANLNYAYLTPERYEFVIRNAYELILSAMMKKFPHVKFVFEASGYTIEQMAEKTPDVLEKLRSAIASGQCEFMGSPHAHPMLPNFPKEDGIRSIRFSNDIYEKFLGMKPNSFWNPECGWRSFVPEQVTACGYRNLLGDFEAYSRSLGQDGLPLRPEIYEKEHSDDPAFYNFGFQYDLPGTEKAIHFPFQNIANSETNSLRIFLRSDRIAQFGVRYFMGMDGYSLEKYLDLVRKYSQQNEGEAEGALIIFADDAEYIGTNGWFKLKYLNQPDNVFEATPDSREKLIDLISACAEMGRFITFEEACRNLPALPDEITFDDDSAWHGARASTWAQTPMARLLRPWQDLVREKLVANADSLSESEQRAAWFHLTNSYNSDGQWPPTLPEAPHIIHPFNYQYCFENLLQAELLIGGVDRSRLDTDPVRTINEILGPQQRLILEKAKTLVDSSDKAKKRRGEDANFLIHKSMVVSSLRNSGEKILYPSEYRIRAELLAQARQLVGGIEIEKN